MPLKVREFFVSTGENGGRCCASLSLLCSGDRPVTVTDRLKAFMTQLLVFDVECN